MPTYTRDRLTAQAQLTTEDLEQIRQRRRDYSRLGFAYQLAFVRLLNRFPVQQPFEVIDEILTYVGIQLDIPTAKIADYSRRRMSVSEHQERIRRYLGRRRFSEAEDEVVAVFVFEQACRLEQTHALLAQVKEFLRHQGILEPADDTLERLIQRQRRQARTFIFDKVSSLLDAAGKEHLDALLTAGEGSYSPLHRLKQTPRRASPSALLRLTKNLDEMTRTGVLDLDLSWLNNNFQRALARYARRCTVTRLRRLKPGRRYTVLVCFLRLRYQDTVDDLVTMYDKLMNLVYNRAQRDLDQHARTQRKRLRTSLSTFSALADMVLDESIQDGALRQMIFERIGRSDLASHASEVETWLSGKHSHVLNLVTDRFSYLRQFAPALFEHLHLEPESSTDGALLEAVDLLQQMNASRKRKLPDDAPLEFMPKATQALVRRNGQLDKSTWECALLTAVRDHIKSGNVAVLGSKRFGHLDDFFMPEKQWQALRDDFFDRAGLPRWRDEVASYLTDRLGRAYDRFLKRLPENSYAQLDESGSAISG